MSNPANNNGRWSGSSFTLDAPAGAPGSSAPAYVPTPPASGAPVAPSVNPNPAPAAAPQPQPGQPGQVEPFQMQPKGHPILSKLFWIVVGAALLVVLWKGIPWIGSMFGNNDSAPVQTGQQDPAPSGSQTGNDSQTNGGQTQTGSDTNANQGGQDNTPKTMAEEAALLDPWFNGVPESSWVRKTTADLGVTTSTPLGQFCAKFCVVLSDGTVIARGTSETGEAIPAIITDYKVPTDWYGKAVAVDEQKIGLVLVIAQVPTNRDQKVPGQIWEWSNDIANYSYSGTGEMSPYAE